MLQMKPVRTLSGVATVSVLTRHIPARANASSVRTTAHAQKLLADEPGALRAGQNAFDPYRQVASRLASLAAVGHPVEKVELLILGGSWNAYPPEYREDSSGAVWMR